MKALAVIGRAVFGLIVLGGGLETVGGTPEQFARFIAAEITKWTKIAKDVGAKVD